MSTHTIGFYEDLTKIIIKYTHLISSSELDGSSLVAQIIFLVLVKINHF